MIRYEDDCVDCTQYCVGSQCRKCNVALSVCDDCGAEAAYIIDNKEFCLQCASQYLNWIWNNFTIIDKAKALGIECEVIR